MAILGMLFLSYFVIQGQVMPCQAETKLIASDAASYDFLGYSVSTSGDTVVVGTPYNGNTGAAYVFRRDGAGWGQVAKLTVSDAGLYSLFGVSVSMSGDTIVVGAPLSGKTGAAYVFRYTGAGWAQVAKLIADDPSSFSFFGISVAVTGDTIVVGAYGDDDYAGSAYVFSYDGAGWRQVGKLIADDAARSDFFGVSVSVNGDTVVVGAYGDDYDAGSAYVFRHDGAGWTQVAKLTASDATPFTLFGISVAVSGNTVVVGAPYSRAVGSAYVFACGDAGCTQVQKLTAGDGSPDDTFGTSVSLSGKTLMIGGPSNHGGVSYSGAAYIFRYDGSAWTQAEKMISSDAAPYDSFGACVSVSGNTAVAGAPDDDTSRGSAYVFDLDGGALEVYVDIKPGSCSNPLNPKGRGVLPVAILGTMDFDVTAIDPATLRLSREGVEGAVAPMRESYEDVAISVQEDASACDQPRGDGFVDLTLKFDTEELVEILRLREVAGETIPLLLTGNLKEEFGGTPIEGQDDIKVLSTGKK
jgi:hypothetical protein